jgi:GH24 family phage-related lysozyme (muramidase)
VYTDTTGHLTICYGFNLEKSGAAAEIKSVGGDFHKLTDTDDTNDERCLTQTQCEKLLTPDVNAATSQAASIFGTYCACVQAVLTDFTYNVGEGTAATFTTFKSYLQAGNYQAAANDLKTSLWCKQVGTRCTDDTTILAQGC